MMGIPRLTSYLRPYAELCQLDGSQVVIDGPALAFHIIHLCRLALGTDGPSSEPTYALLGQTAVDWLDLLQAHGIMV